MASVQSGTILMVEDNSSILNLFGTTLRQEGFTVLEASNIQGALQVCRQHSGPIDLLLADLLLPNDSELQVRKDRAKGRQKNGLDLMREVVGLRPRIRILLMSGRPDAELNAIGAFKEGKPILRKPLRPETLLSTIRQVLENPHDS